VPASYLCTHFVCYKIAGEGISPQPQWNDEGKEAFSMPRKRSKQLKFFVSDKELERIKDKVAASKLNQSDFLRKSALEKDIIVIDGIREFVLELKRIGVNLNQLTKLANQRIVMDCNEELQTIHGEMSEVWQSLRQLIRKSQR